MRAVSIETCIHFPLPYLLVQLQIPQLSFWRNHKYCWAAYTVTMEGCHNSQIEVNPLHHWCLPKTWILAKIPFLCHLPTCICSGLPQESTWHGFALTRWVSVLLSSLSLDLLTFCCQKHVDLLRVPLVHRKLVITVCWIWQKTYLMNFIWSSWEFL